MVDWKPDQRYSKWYFDITSRAQTRETPSGYYERHHIIPKFAGGNNHKSNIATLTAREHLICHLLLIRMTSGKAKASAIFSAACMLRVNPAQLRTHANTKVIAAIRAQMAEVSRALHKGKTVTAEQKRKQSIAMTGRKATPETREKIRLASKNRRHSATTRQRISLANSGKKRTPAQNYAQSQRQLGTQQGTENPNAQVFIFTDPLGIEHVCKGTFKAFCNKHNLAYSTMLRLLYSGTAARSGSTLGWNCRHLQSLSATCDAANEPCLATPA